jgi:NAD(P)H-dependent flavin oxidoreductase YrpB (nitropropane dioxygenase family)
MPQQIFKSQYPILEACMNKGSTLPLAIAVHEAGAYPSLCSWTYGSNFQMLQKELDNFVNKTNSNKIQISFDIDELPSPSICHEIVKSYNLPTIEIIYNHMSNATFLSDHELDKKIIDTLKPLHEQGVKIFKRSIAPTSQEETSRYFLDGFCIKGVEAAGYGSKKLTCMEIFKLQQKITPSAYLIPYGGIGSAEQVKEYIDLGAEMVGVGTVLAFSSEGLIKQETKLAAIAASKDDLSNFNFNTDGRQNALKFDEYTGPDTKNHTNGLKAALWNKNSSQGHIFVGHSIDQVTEILPCKQIVQNLVANLT